MSSTIRTFNSFRFLSSTFILSHHGFYQRNLEFSPHNVHDTQNHTVRRYFLKKPALRGAGRLGTVCIQAILGQWWYWLPYSLYLNVHDRSTKLQTLRKLPKLLRSCLILPSSTKWRNCSDSVAPELLWTSWVIQPLLQVVIASHSDMYTWACCIHGSPPWHTAYGLQLGWWGSWSHDDDGRSRLSWRCQLSAHARVQGILWTPYIRSHDCSCSLEYTSS
jgi:hypothetical protein